MVRVVYLLLLAFVAASACLPAGALELDRRRMLTAEEHVPWRGVGRVNVAGLSALSMCTGTLIAEDIVLTAAHCVMNRITGRPHRPESVHFVAGWRLGRKVAHREAKAIAVHPGYRFVERPTDEHIGADVALIRLAEPIPREKAPFFTVAPAPEPGTPLTLISYRRDRANALTRQDGCAIRSVRGPVMELGCNVTFGASGSALFVTDGAERRVVAVLSAKGNDPRRDTAFAVLVDAALAEVMAALE